jgi:hypothetical protein
MISMPTLFLSMLHVRLSSGLLCPVRHTRFTRDTPTKTARVLTHTTPCCGQGLDLAVQNMHVGDLWKLTLPASLAFGEKGTKASAGKPRIPGAPWTRAREQEAAR